jgi:hypothetical protein
LPAERWNLEMPMPDTRHGEPPTPSFPIHPKHPERICWGCDKYCPADDLRCGNGTIRAPHPVELLGDDWWEWENQTKHG